MGSENVPGGIKQATGLLFKNFGPGTVSAGASGTDRLRFALGPGFAIGIWGYQISANGWTGADGQEISWELTTDLDATAANLNRTPALAEGNAVTQLTTSGNPFIKAEWVQSWAAPMFIVQDLLYVATVTNVALSVAGKLYFAIYEVTDAQFIRIAGVNLAKA